jgi:hypothetical protein
MFMMKTVCLLFPFAFLACQNLGAQGEIVQKNNILSFELGKNGLIYNLSFDRKLKHKPVGFRIFAGSNFGRSYLASTAGAGIYFLAGSKNNKFEMGTDFSYLYIDETSDDQKGFTILFPQESIKTYYLALNLGLRHSSKNTVFRIGLSPGIIKSRFLPGGYCSIGAAF